MKLSRAYLCLDCEELLEPNSQCCLSCGAGPLSIFPLANFIKLCKMEAILRTSLEALNPNKEKG